jgi:hypothetical protein
MILTHQFSYDTYADAVEDYFRQGFTDGLPVVPPTPVLVSEMLGRAGLDAGDILGEVPTRDIVVTAEKAAVNAVMAGCLPEYFPVVVAAVRAHLLPKGNSHSTTATLAGAAHAVIINGPVRKDIDVCSGQACFGPGFRANATIGRALRLVIRNVCNSVPGVLDRATFSWPLRYSFCFGENEESSDWLPLHVQRGFNASDSVVTVQSVFEFLQVLDFDPAPESILESVAVTARQRGLARDEWCGDDRGVVVVVGLEHQQRLVAAGWTKQDVQEFLWPLLAAASTGRHDLQVSLARPDNVLVVAAGGPGIAVSWVLLPHLSNPISQRVG